MKRWIGVAALLLVTVMIGWGIKQAESKQQEPEAEQGFSYTQVTAAYPAGTPGVFTAGFKNIAKSPVSTAKEAIAQAKKECTITYNQIDATYDRDTKIWQIRFSTKGVLGGDQRVYLDCNGITQLIVYGE